METSPASVCKPGTEQRCFVGAWAAPDDAFVCSKDKYRAADKLGVWQAICALLHCRATPKPLLDLPVGQCSALYPRRCPLSRQEPWLVILSRHRMQTVVSFSYAVISLSAYSCRPVAQFRCRMRSEVKQTRTPSLRTQADAPSGAAACSPKARAVPQEETPREQDSFSPR